MTEGQILYKREGDSCLIKLVGCIRYTMSERFEAFIRNLFVQHAPKHITIDLQETDHIDSTNLGLLARLARYTGSHTDALPVINTDREDILLLLETMGFDQVFTIRNLESVPAHALAEIPETSGGDGGVANTILAAHQMLMNMNEKNRDRFKDAVEMMEADTQSEKADER